MKTAKDLTREELELIVTTAQEMFWTTYTKQQVTVWDRDTEWNWERVEEIAGVMDKLGLRPEQGHDD